MLGKAQSSPAHEREWRPVFIARLESPAELDHLDAVGRTPDDAAAGTERRVRIEGFGLHFRRDEARGEAAQATRIG
jgi:hypothetical protein